MTPHDTAEVERVAASLTKAQRETLVDAVRFLDAIAGEGIGHQFDDGTTLYGDEVLYHLFNAFLPDWDGEGTYTDTARHILERSQNDE